MNSNVLRKTCVLGIRGGSGSRGGRISKPRGRHAPKFRFLVLTVDKYVAQDYSVTHLHCGVTSMNKPPVPWLRKAYKAYDRKYKKNMRALYLDRPNNFIHIVRQEISPAVRVKFGQNMMYVNYMREIEEHLRQGAVWIPESVPENTWEYLNLPHRRPQFVNPPQTHQFGITLEFVCVHKPGLVDSIPPITHYCVDYLQRPEGMETDDISRPSTSRSSPNMNALARMMEGCSNLEERMDFQHDRQCSADLMKTCLKFLENPVLTRRLYEESLQFSTRSMAQKPILLKFLLFDKLSPKNYMLLKKIIRYMWRVSGMKSLYKMNISNMTVGFGPSMLWPSRGQLSLQCIFPLNVVVDFLKRRQQVQAPTLAE